MPAVDHILHDLRDAGIPCCVVRAEHVLLHLRAERAINEARAEVRRSERLLQHSRFIYWRALPKG